ncbi:MAG TPA: PH domain-containing protein, partial [Humisphaera sp.]|nr:PH domain-containing protein [Humisphaera sp.]
IGLLLVCIPPLRAKTIRYRVTNYRIDYERGLIGKDIDTLELWHVEDIQFHQTYRDRFLAMGTIVVISHDLTTPRLVMHSLPNSRHLFDQLKQRIIAVKRQRGVLKMDTGS